MERDIVRRDEGRDGDAAASSDAGEDSSGDEEDFRVRESAG